MAKDIRLPRLGESMEEGTIVKWLIKPGDSVNLGDVILEVETDKATIEMESPAGGVVKDILVDTGHTVPVDTPLLVIGEKDEQVDQAFLDELSADIPACAAATEETNEHHSHIFASPRAHELAEELGIDLATITPSTGTARIVEADVRHAAGIDPIASGKPLRPGQTIPLTRLQKITAQRMLQSKRNIPCFYLSAKVDLTELLEQRQKLNEASDTKISINDFLIRATAIALEKYPVMTGQLGDDCIDLPAGIGIGLAITRDDGLVSPTVKDPDKMNLVQTANYTKALIERARSNKLTLDDLEGACITISNLGSLGVESFIPIVVPGQCSIFGIGTIIDTCVPSREGVKVRKIMGMTIAVDHKVANGADAAQFLDHIKKTLENPSSIE